MQSLPRLESLRGRVAIPPIRLGSERFYSCEMFMIESRSEKKEDGCAIATQGGTLMSTR